MMKCHLASRCSVQKISAEFEFGGHSPRVSTPKDVAFGYDVGKISADCLGLVVSVDWNAKIGNDSKR